MKTLNYRYGLLLTQPQRLYLNRLMRESRIQYNRAVATRKRLKGSLQCRKVDVVLREILSAQKDNSQHRRREAIEKIEPIIRVVHLNN